MIEPPRERFGGAPRVERNIAQTAARMHRKIIHTLLSLFNYVSR